MAKKGKRIIAHLKSIETGIRNYTILIHRDNIKPGEELIFKKYDPKLKRHTKHKVVKK